MINKNPIEKQTHRFIVILLEEHTARALLFVFNKILSQTRPQFKTLAQQSADFNVFVITSYTARYTETPTLLIAYFSTRLGLSFCFSLRLNAYIITCAHNASEYFSVVLKQPGIQSTQVVSLLYCQARIPMVKKVFNTNSV